MQLMRKLSKTESDKEEDIDEQLGTYGECLGMKNRKSWLIEELNLRNNLGIICMKEKLFKDLKDEKITFGKRIKSTHNYEITSNNRYAVMF